MSTALSDIFKPALRIAGITLRPGITPGSDRYAELVPAFNRMVSSWNIRRLCIFTTRIDSYTLIAGRKLYTIGPGGDFNATRPIKIEQAVIVLNATSPATRLPPLYLMTDEDWANIAVQDIPNTIPMSLYNDGAFPLSNLYLWGQAASPYSLELHTWQQLTASFTAETDLLVVPPGYEHAMVLNFALETARLYPTEAKIDPTTRRAAQEALGAVQSRNAPTYNRMRSDAAGVFGGSGGSGRGYATIMGGGSPAAAVNWQAPTSQAPNGVVTTFTFASTPHQCLWNGLIQLPGIGYSLLTASTVQFLDHLGNIVAPATGAILRGDL